MRQCDNPLIYCMYMSIYLRCPIPVIKNVDAFGRRGVKRMRPIFKNETLIHQ